MNAAQAKVASAAHACCTALAGCPRHSVPLYADLRDGFGDFV